jgi:hypothetical protein
MLQVNGGPAESGIKRPLQEPRGDWTCTAGHVNRGYCVRCLVAGCNERRP